MTIEELKIITEDFFGVSLIPVDRKAHNVRVRYVYYHTVYRMFPNMTLVQIGKSLGQDHATVVHALKTLDSMLAFDKRFSESVQGFELYLDKTVKDNKFIIEDFDVLRNNRKALANLASKKKIKEQRLVIKAQNKLIIQKNHEINTLKHKIKLYKKLTGV